MVLLLILLVVAVVLLVVVAVLPVVAFERNSYRFPLATQRITGEGGIVTLV